MSTSRPSQEHEYSTSTCHTHHYFLGAAAMLSLPCHVINNFSPSPCPLPGPHSLPHHEPHHCWQRGGSRKSSPSTRALLRVKYLLVLLLVIVPCKLLTTDRSHIKPKSLMSMISPICCFQTKKIYSVCLLFDFVVLILFFSIYCLGCMRHQWTAPCYPYFEKAKLQQDQDGKVITLKAEDGQSYPNYLFKCKWCVLTPVPILCKKSFGSCH